MHCLWAELFSKSRTFARRSTHYQKDVDRNCWDLSYQNNNLCTEGLTDSSSFSPFGMQTIFIGNKYSVFLLVTKELSFTSKMYQ